MTLGPAQMPTTRKFVCLTMVDLMDKVGLCVTVIGHKVRLCNRVAPVRNCEVQIVTLNI